MVPCRYEDGDVIDEDLSQGNVSILLSNLILSDIILADALSDLAAAGSSEIWWQMPKPGWQP